MWQVIEAIASIAGIASVILSVLKYVWVYPTGMVSTVAYIFIMLRANLLGDALVNVIYTLMSAYGWYQWSKSAQNGKVSVRRANRRELLIGSGLLVASFLTVWAVYTFSRQPVNWADVASTAIFVVAMWYMAIQAIESWILWLIGDAMSVYKVASKGLYFTTAQYCLLTGMAVWGFYEWWRDIQHAEMGVDHKTRINTGNEPLAQQVGV